MFGCSRYAYVHMIVVWSTIALAVLFGCVMRHAACRHHRIRCDARNGNGMIACTR